LAGNLERANVDQVGVVAKPLFAQDGRWCLAFKVGGSGGGGGGLVASGAGLVFGLLLLDRLDQAFLEVVVQNRHLLVEKLHQQGQEGPVVLLKVVPLGLEPLFEHDRNSDADRHNLLDVNVLDLLVVDIFVPGNGVVTERHIIQN